jgi:hypothetical protein
MAIHGRWLKKVGSDKSDNVLSDGASREAAENRSDQINQIIISDGGSDKIR